MDHKPDQDERVVHDDQELTPNQKMLVDGIDTVLRLLVAELRRREPKESALNIVNEVKRRAIEFYGGEFWTNLFDYHDFNLKVAISRIAENIFNRITREGSRCDPLHEEDTI